jgi:hypothetical protein
VRILTPTPALTKASCILSIPVATAPEGAKGGVGRAIAILKPTFKAIIIPLTNVNALSIFLIKLYMLLSSVTILFLFSIIRFNLSLSGQASGVGVNPS